MKLIKKISLLLLSVSLPGFAQPDTLFRSGAAVSEADGAALSHVATPNLTGNFAGRLPGLMVIGADGMPGYGTVRMLVRGMGSYARGTETNTLKYYVDGFQVAADYVDFLSPEEIASVSILKDAATLSVFGMNGADGVLWIETRRGAEHAPEINFSARSGVQQAVNVAKPLRSYDYARLYNIAASNDAGAWTPYYSQDELTAWQNGTGTDVSWYDEVYRPLGLNTDAALTVRGGSSLVRYALVLDYANQQGLLNVRNTDKTSNLTYAKYGVRTNLDINFGRVLSVRVDVGGRLEDRSRPAYDVWTLTQDVLNYPSNIYPVFDELSTDPISNFSGTAVHPNNPVGSLIGNGWRSSRTKVLQTNFKFKEDLGFLLKGLYLQEGLSFYSRTVGNTGKTATYARYMNGVAQTSDQSTYIRSNAYSTSGEDRWMQGSVTAGYARQFGLHGVLARVDAHISDFNGSGSAFYNWKYRYINYSGVARYDYDGRYEAGIGFSLFGSDAFAPGRRYGFFPSADVAWHILPTLKLRASAGLSGATEADIAIGSFSTAGRYLYEQYYAAGAEGFETGPGPNFGWGQSGLVPLFKANDRLSAEKSLKIDVGVDGNLWEVLSFTLDGFLDKRSDIVTLDSTLPDYEGEKTYYANIGRMTNMGVDGSIRFAKKTPDMAWSAFLNGVLAVNRVDEMGEVAPKYAYNAATGHPYAARMGLECIGFYEASDFGLDGNLKGSVPQPLFGSVQPGDLKYKDQDDDGYVDETDIVCIGRPAYPLAQLALGGDFAWKGLDAQLLLTASFGGTVNLLDYSAWQPFLNYGNVFAWAENAWAYYPEAGIDTRETATFPRLTTQQNQNNYRPSSFWIRSNNWLRLQTVELGYDFSVLRAVRQAGFSKCRLYLSGNNLLTLSSLLGRYKMDPETANYGYPALRSISMGLQIGF